MNTLRSLSARAAAVLVLAASVISPAYAMAPCYTWYAMDGGIAWGSSSDPLETANAWADAHNFGAVSTANTPTSVVCIRNVYVYGDYPNYSVSLEYAGWSTVRKECGINWHGGSFPLFRSDNQCKVYTQADAPQLGNSCSAPSSPPMVGDPIEPSSGNMSKVERDFDAHNGGLHFFRYYNSQGKQGTRFGPRWRSSYSRSIAEQRDDLIFKPYQPVNTSSQYTSETAACASGFQEIKSRYPNWATASASYTGGRCVVTDGVAAIGTVPILYTHKPTPAPGTTAVVSYEVTRDDGQVIRFQKVGTTLTAPNGVPLKLVQTSTGFELTDQNDAVETYDSAGRLISIRTRTGVVFTVGYDSAGLLSSVTDGFGSQIQLGYTNGTIESFTDSGGGVTQYAYDTSGRLQTVTYPDLTTRSYIYDDPNDAQLLTGLVDEQGVRYSTWEYDAQGRAVSTHEAGGANAVSLDYHSNGTATATDALGAERTFSYARYGDLNLSHAVSGSQCPGCEVGASTIYSPAGFPSSSTDYNGHVTTFTYNPARGLETSRTEAYGTPRARTIEMTWHATLRLPVLIEEPTRTTEFEYDANGNLLSRTITDTVTSGNPSRTWAYTYDAYGHVLTEDGPRLDVNDVTTYTYYTCTTGGACGQLHTITDAVGHVTTYNTYNNFGRPLTLTDPNGVLSTMTYDSRGHLETISVAGELTTLDYWPTGKLRKVISPDGSSLLLTYDSAQRLKKIEDAAGNRIEYTLDAMGNRTAENVYDSSSALSRTRSQVFNTLSRLWKDVPASGSSVETTTLGYDSNGNLTSQAAPLSRSSSMEYDELNRLFRVTDPGSGVTTLAYDANDNVQSVTDPRNLTTTYGYNGFGERVQLMSPETGTTTYAYDDAGNLHTSTDARGITGTRGYDALNRLTSITYPDQSVTFSYDSGTNGSGRMTGAVDANHSMAWSYDTHGRVTGVTQAVGGVIRSVGYGYQNGNLTSVTTPSGQVVGYGYTNGRVSSVTINGSTLLSGVIHDPFGPPRQWSWGNSTIEVRTRDLDGKLSQLDGGGELSEYAYDEASRIEAISNASDPPKSWSYDYDSLDRLTQATASSRTDNWTYDANGNRLTESGNVSGTPYSSSYSISGTKNRLTSISGSRANSYSYDAAGNITGETNAGRAVVLSGATSVDYVYNALSQRIRKSGPQGSVYFVYDQAGHLLGEYGAGGTLIQETVWLDDLPIATLRPKVGGGVDVYYVHADHLGTPRKVTRPADNVLVWRWDSTAFGMNLANENPQAAGVFQYNLRFPGQYFDAESGLSYNYFRDYDPATGRYVQSDPIGLEGGINTYAYASGNPIQWIDPDGLDVAVVENGPTSGNPVGHTAVAVTGAGVYSYGNSTPAGSSLNDYLRRESPRRDTKVYVITTTPQQDAAVVEYLRRFPNTSLPGDFLSKYFTDNCSVRSNEALDAASVPVVPTIPGYMGPSTPPLGQPGTSGMRAMAAGATVISIPRGTTTMPPQLRQFEPR